MRALRVSQLALGARSVRVAPSASEATSAVAGLPGPAAISVDLRLPTCIHALACPWLPRVVRGPSTRSAGPRGRSNLNRIKYGGDRVIHLPGWLSSCRLRRPRPGRAYVRTCPASCHGHAAGRAGLPPTARRRWPCSAANSLQSRCRVGHGRRAGAWRAQWVYALRAHDDGSSAVGPRSGTYGLGQISLVVPMRRAEWEPEGRGREGKGRRAGKAGGGGGERGREEELYRCREEGSYQTLVPQCASPCI